MQTQQAEKLISGSHFSLSNNQVWADLGCGTGTFTLALAKHLSVGSKIFAIDKKRRALEKIPNIFNRVYIETEVTNFIKDEVLLNNLDGILMANSLHYVQNQDDFIVKLRKALKPGGSFLIVEYDTDSSNFWVPYPIYFEHLKKLFKNAGFSSVKKIGEMPSRYNRSNLYSALIK